MRQNNKHFLIDGLFIILNITFYLSVVKVITFDIIPIPPIISLFAFTFFLYLYRWGNNLPFIYYVKKSLLMILFFVIYIIDIAQNLLINMESAFTRMLVLANMFFFCAYLYNMVRKERCYEDIMERISKPYIYYCSYNVIVIVLAGFMIAAGVLSPTDNLLPVNSLTQNNVMQGQTYYFPFYLSIVTESTRLLSSWGIPMITGLSHEPHVINYIVLPSLFFFLSMNLDKKYIYCIYPLYVLMLFFAFSTTAFICISIVTFFELLWAVTQKRNATSVVPIIIVVLVVFYGFNSIFYNLIQEELVRKTVSSTESMNYSANFLYYLTHPIGIIGTGNMPGVDGDLLSKDVGAITFMLDIIFFILMILSTIRMVFSANKHKHYVGLACLYFIIHSLKVNILVFSYPYFAFMVFIISLNGYFIKGMNHKKIRSNRRKIYV